MSYDPLRYYWSAVFSVLWGNEGIVPIRFSIAIIQALGIFYGIRILQQEKITIHPFMVAILSIALAAWMSPRHKTYDAAIAIFSVFSVTVFLSNPNERWNEFRLGLAVGFAALVGRNHGVYALFGAILAYSTSLWHGSQEGNCRIRSINSFTMGVIVGYSPIAVWMLFYQGAFGAFVDSVLFLFTIESTNLPLPVPWPTPSRIISSFSLAEVRDLLLGIGFVWFALCCFLAPAVLFLSRWLPSLRSPMLIGSACLVLPYVHYAFSRADIGHFALGIFPIFFFTIALVQLCKPYRTLILLALTASGLTLALPYISGWKCLAEQPCHIVEVHGDQIAVDANQYSEISVVQDAVSSFGGKENGFLVAPFMPGAYALYSARSPMWAVYALWARGEQAELREIQRMEESKISFALLDLQDLDGRKELNFASTNPRVLTYIEQKFAKFKIVNSHVRLYYGPKNSSAAEGMIPGD
ncbi:MAG: hypothetical protein KF767_07195 [Bdellovibrionaceae bacterium]|nr:hypothetical protein [Pseudobdellovibrionaceae bacterium]